MSLLDLQMKEYICLYYSQSMAEGLVENGVEYATKKQRKTIKFFMGVLIAQDSQDCVSPHVSGNTINIKNVIWLCEECLIGNTFKRLLFYL